MKKKYEDVKEDTLRPEAVEEIQSDLVEEKDQDLELAVKASDEVADAILEGESDDALDSDQEEELDEIGMLEQEVSGLQTQLKSEKEGTLRAMAELENFKKRKEQEVQNYKRYANEGLISELLVVLDSFYLALAQSDSEEDKDGVNHTHLCEGVSLILKQLEGVLKKTGVTEIECENKKFDPHFHQAVSQKENTEVDDETVLEVMQKGYLLHERVIRPAMVVVSKA